MRSERVLSQFLGFSYPVIVDLCMTISDRLFTAYHLRFNIQLTVTPDPRHRVKAAKPTICFALGMKSSQGEIAFVPLKLSSSNAFWGWNASVISSPLLPIAPGSADACKDRPEDNITMGVENSNFPTKRPCVLIKAESADCDLDWRSGDECYQG